MDPFTYGVSIFREDEFRKQLTESFKDELREQTESVHTRLEIVPGGAVLHFEKPLDKIFFSKKGCKAVGDALRRRAQSMTEILTAGVFIPVVIAFFAGWLVASLFWSFGLVYF